jgi:hemolysin activation/secretion protein
MKSVLLVVAVLATAPSAYAQPIGGGAQLQQIPPAPAQPKAIPDIRVERGQPSRSPSAAGPRIPVNTLHVTGETRFTEAELIAASGFKPGTELDLGGLRAMAARISDLYSRQGYFVAQAYIAAQDVSAGAVTITVVEGRYGKVALDDRARVSSHLARSILAGLEPGDVVATAPLERRLLLLSDLPGVAVRSTLSPGQAVGASDLLVALTPGRSLSGSLEGDNAGNRYTGQYRGGGTINLNEPFGFGDVASLRVLTAGRGLNYVRGSYQGQVQDATVGVAYAHLDYRLGREFSALGARGSVDIASVYGSYPLIRSRATDLYLIGDLDARQFKDRVTSTDSVTKKSANVASIGLAGNHRDNLWAGGWTTWSAYWAIGDLDIKTPAVRAIDALTARTNGGYNKVTFDAARVQGLRGPISLYGGVRGQLASKNLDSSEKMELGGAYGVRAYPEGEAYGDEGYIVTAEARLALARLSELTRGHLQAAAFVDHGHITINKNPWAAGPNSRSLSAAGLGLTWSSDKGLLVKVSYAAKLGSEHALSAPDRSGRVWVQISQLF